MRSSSRFRHLAAAAAVIALLTLGATRGRADVAPEDHRKKPCTAPGQTCNSAGPEEDKPGTCVAATCTKEMRTPDGGTMSVKIDCFHCMAAGPEKATSQPKSRSSGCGVAPERGDKESPAVTGSLIGGLLLVARRRRCSRGIGRRTTSP
jgi:MYXO-CTERM domain-containing protein